MPKKSAKSETADSFFTAIGFGAFMYSFAVPLLLLLGTKNTAFTSSILAASAGLAAYSTVKTKRAVNYTKNLIDNTVGVNTKKRKFAISW